MNLINAAKITELRESRGWDQRQLAKEANIDPSVISRLERSLQSDTRLSVIVAIATALKVDVQTLLYSYENESSSDTKGNAELRSLIPRLERQSIKVQKSAINMLNGLLMAWKE